MSPTAKPVSRVYSLASSKLVYAPGIVQWAINAAQFADDRKRMIHIVASTWNIPKFAAEQLITKKVPYDIVGETVRFQTATQKVASL
jgi:hypothetical protein